MRRDVPGIQRHSLPLPGSAMLPRGFSRQSEIGRYQKHNPRHTNKTEAQERIDSNHISTRRYAPLMNAFQDAQRKRIEAACSGLAMPPPS